MQGVGCRGVLVERLRLVNVARGVVTVEELLEVFQAFETFLVWGLGFGVWGLGFGGWGVGFGVPGVGFVGVRMRVSHFGFRVYRF